LRFAPQQWPGHVVRRDAADGTHLLVRGSGFSHQRWFPGAPSEGAVITAILPMDLAMPNRIEATLRFWYHSTYGGSRSQPGRPLRLDRLITTLRALDGHLAGASYRAIANDLFTPDRVAADPWKTSPLRDRAIRLVRQGLSLMKGGYRKLLKPRNRG
jgi:hypothetical protein